MNSEKISSNVKYVPIYGCGCSKIDQILVLVGAALKECQYVILFWDSDCTD